MVLWGGVNIAPREIEEVLFDHPAVVDCAVFGVPDERDGERSKAMVQLRDPVGTTDELAAHVAATGWPSTRCPANGRSSTSSPVTPTARCASVSCARPTPRRGPGAGGSRVLRIVIDRDKCVGSGNCVYWAPATFDLDDEGSVGGDRPAGRRREAASGWRRRVARSGRSPSRWSDERCAGPARRRDGTEKGDPMPIALTEEHEAQRRSVRAVARRPTARRACRGPCSTRRPKSSSRSGRRWPRRVGWASTFPRSSVARDSGSSSWPSCSRRPDGPWCRGRSCPRCVTSAVVAEAADRRRSRGCDPARLVDGSTPPPCPSGTSRLERGPRRGSGTLTVAGTLRPVLGASTATTVLAAGPLAPTGASSGASSTCAGSVGRSGGRPRWPASTRPGGWATVEVDAATRSTRRSPAARALTTGGVRQVAVALMAAEHVGRRPLVPRDGHRVRQGPPASSAGPSGSSRRSSTGWPTWPVGWSR